ncbi:ankyrin repeat domain-containing protein 31 [Ranitomeya variabilis]|uniref:ankyrin repeat domain-containing protein 31 n=1 Tax=Ranitomeya variabilis TaxID=490064 RepID=UPI0040568456
MKAGITLESKKTPMHADYDSDETMVDDSILGSDEEEDDSYFKRIFINDDYSPTSDSGLCPGNKNVVLGEQSPEIHLVSKFFPAAQANSMETASKQVSDTLLEEEASQSLLRNWKRLPPHKDTGDSPPSMDPEGLCEDAQQLFDSCELEDNNVDESQDTSLQSAIIQMDVCHPKKELVSSDKTLDIPEKKHNVNDTSEDGVAHIVCEESRIFIDEINIDDLLKMSGEMVSFTELIGDLSFLEMPEDGSDELNCTLLAEINSMQHPQSLQSAGEGCSMEGDHPDRQGNSDCSNKQQLPGTDESVKHNREDYGLAIQKTDKETPEESVVNVESTGISPSLLNIFGCIPNGISHVFNVEKQSVTQKSLPVSTPNSEKSTLNKGTNVSWNGSSHSQTSLPCLEEVKSISEVSKTATCSTAGQEQLQAESTEQAMESINKDCMLLMSQNNTDFEMDQQHKVLSKSPKRKKAQDTHFNENTIREEEETKRGLLERYRTCGVPDSEGLFQSAKSSTELMGSRSKNATVSRGRKRKSKLSQPYVCKKVCQAIQIEGPFMGRTSLKKRNSCHTCKTMSRYKSTTGRSRSPWEAAGSFDLKSIMRAEMKSTESTKTTEIILRKSVRRRILRNSGSCCEREKGTYRVSWIDDPKTCDCTSPALLVSSQLNNTEPVQQCRASKTVRNINKRNFMGETLLHKACKKGDLEQVNALIEAGINVNHTDNAGWTALHEASCKGNSEVIEALIQAGAYVNGKGLDGILPLHDAVYCNHYKAAEILIKFGANPYLKDDNMKNAFDKCCSNKMAEILTSQYRPSDTAIGNVLSEKEDPQRKNMTILPSSANVCRAGRACSVEILDTLHDIENKHKKLLSTELEPLEDAEKCVEELNEIQNVLNNIVNLQKIERDNLAKKYRASADSFKQGKLRDKMAKLASNQKTLLQVVRNQKEVTLKIVAKQSERSGANSEETSSTLQYCDASPGRNPISALCAVNEWLEANIANGSTMTTIIPAVDRVPDTESNPAKKAISISSPISSAAELCTAAIISERTAQPNSHLTPKQKPGLENSPLSFDSCCIILNDHPDTTAPGSRSQDSFPVSLALDIIGKKNISIEKNSHEISDETHETADTGQHLQRSNYEIQQESDDFPDIYDASEYWRPQHKEKGPTSHILSQKVCENNDNQPVSEKQACIEADKKIRKFPLKKLMKMGTLKPGVDVLSFQLQDSSHKATLLCDGQITDCSGAIFRDPLHWVKTLLGNNIVVTWKYIIDKVTYIGKKLSSFIGQEDFAPKIEEPDPERNIAISPPHLQTPSNTLFQVKEILLVDQSEFFPSHVMEKYWEEFMNSNVQDF